MLAVGSPLIAAVAVNALIAWLIILAGVVHLILGFHQEPDLPGGSSKTATPPRRPEQH